MLASILGVLGSASSLTCVLLQLCLPCHCIELSLVLLTFQVHFELALLLHRDVTDVTAEGHVARLVLLSTTT